MKKLTLLFGVIIGIIWVICLILGMPAVIPVFITGIIFGIPIGIVILSIKRKKIIGVISLVIGLFLGILIIGFYLLLHMSTRDLVCKYQLAKNVEVGSFKKVKVPFCPGWRLLKGKEIEYILIPKDRNYEEYIKNAEKWYFETEDGEIYNCFVQK